MPESCQIAAKTAARRKLASAVRVSQYGDDAVISNLKNGKWLRVNKQSLRILDRVDIQDVKNSAAIIQNCSALGLSYKDVQEFLGLLIDHGFLVPTGEHDVPATSRFHSAYLNVTNKCNLSCPHCYFRSTPRRSHGLGALELGMIATKLRVAGIDRLTISGGEPLLRPDIILLLERVKDLTFSEVTLLTNGTLISPSLARALAGLVDNIHVSLDGPDDATNALTRGRDHFARTVSGIRLLRESGAKAIRIISTITSDNLDRLDDLRSLAISLGVEFGTSILTTVPSSRRSPVHLPLVPKLEQYFARQVAEICCNSDSDAHNLGVSAGNSCGCGVSMVSVDCIGDLYPCHLFHLPTFKIGTVLKGPLLASLMKDSPVLGHFSRYTVEKRKCHGCHVEYFCKGGCLARTVFHNRRRDNPWAERDPLCRLHKHILSAQVWS